MAAAGLEEPDQNNQEYSPYQDLSKTGLIIEPKLPLGTSLVDGLDIIFGERDVASVEITLKSRLS